MKVGFKKCSKCGIEKAYSEYTKSYNTKMGPILYPQCKQCRKEYADANKERAKEYNRLYYKYNKRKLNENRKNNRKRKTAEVNNG